MPATPASPMFYASAQGDRIPSPGRLDPDYPPFPNHGWAVFAGRMPTNGSSWHAGWPDPMGKGATPRWMSAGWGECLRGHWPQGAPPHLCIVGPDGACCVASQYGQLRPGRGQRAPRAMLPRPQLTLEYQIPVVLPELARAGDEPWPSLDGHGSRSGMARLPRRVTATSGSDPKVPGGDVPPIVHVAPGLPAEQGGRRAAGRGNPGKGSRGQLESYRSACRDAKAAVGKRDRRPPGGGARGAGGSGGGDRPPYRGLSPPPDQTSPTWTLEDLRELFRRLLSGGSSEHRQLARRMPRAQWEASSAPWRRFTAALFEAHRTGWSGMAGHGWEIAVYRELGRTLLAATREHGVDPIAARGCLRDVQLELLTELDGAAGGEPTTGDQEGGAEDQEGGDAPPSLDGYSTPPPPPPLPPHMPPMPPLAPSIDAWGRQPREGSSRRTAASPPWLLPGVELQQSDLLQQKDTERSSVAGLGASQGVAAATGPGDYPRTAPPHLAPPMPPGPRPAQPGPSLSSGPEQGTRGSSGAETLAEPGVGAGLPNDREGPSPGASTGAPAAWPGAGQPAGPPDSGDEGRRGASYGPYRAAASWEPIWSDRLEVLELAERCMGGVWPGTAEAMLFANTMVRREMDLGECLGRVRGAIWGEGGRMRSDWAELRQRAGSLWTGSDHDRSAVVRGSYAT